MKIRVSILILLTVVLSVSCSKTIVEPINEPDEKEENNNNEEENNPNVDYSLLCVGNSLTYYNDLPTLVKEEAESRKIIINTEMLTQGNYAIVDHWADGKVQNMIRSRKYDYVIIQQGPSSQAEGRDMLLNGGKQYADLCKANDTKLAYYMVWPSRRYYHTFDGVIRNYTAAAEINDAILCPVGKVWKDHFDKTNDFSYYGPDQFHPSPLGSKVAARVIVSSLFK